VRGVVWRGGLSRVDEGRRRVGEDHGSSEGAVERLGGVGSVAQQAVS